MGSYNLPLGGIQEKIGFSIAIDREQQKHRGVLAIKYVQEMSVITFHQMERHVQ